MQDIPTKSKESKRFPDLDFHSCFTKKHSSRIFKKIFLLLTKFHLSFTLQNEVLTSYLNTKGMPFFPILLLCPYNSLWNFFIFLFWFISVIFWIFWCGFYVISGNLWFLTFNCIANAKKVNGFLWFLLVIGSVISWVSLFLCVWGSITSLDWYFDS